MSVGLVSVFDRTFDQHVERIKRIVEEEFSHCSAVFDPRGWPIARFRVKDTRGTVMSRTYSDFSMADLENMTDQKLRSLIRRRCQPVAGEEPSGRGDGQEDLTENSVELATSRRFVSSQPSRAYSLEGRKPVMVALPMPEIEVQQLDEVHSRAAKAGVLFQSVKAMMRGRSCLDFPFVLQSVFGRRFSEYELIELKYHPDQDPDELIKQLWYALVLDAYFTGHPHAAIRVRLLPPPETPGCYLWSETA
jgi:hypothetical protein